MLDAPSASPVIQALTPVLMRAVRRLDLGFQLDYMVEAYLDPKPIPLPDT